MERLLCKIPFVSIHLVYLYMDVALVSLYVICLYPVVTTVICSLSGGKIQVSLLSDDNTFVTITIPCLQLSETTGTKISMAIWTVRENSDTYICYFYILLFDIHVTANCILIIGKI